MEAQSTPPENPRWTVLGRYERRVLGVLIEKAKTTKDNYPLSLNALRTGCNQKSNRFPQMELEEHHVEEAIDALRERGALAIIQGDSRVQKYRHLAYDWMGVDKVEIAVMGELLLRGAQTVGELRGRAARMEPIKGLAELLPVLDSLVRKQLVIYLTPPGRGAVVTHHLYEPKELEKVRRDLGYSTEVAAGPSAQPIAAVAAPSSSATPHPADYPSVHHAAEVAAAPTSGAPPSADPARPTPGAAIDTLRRELAEARAEQAATRAELQEEIAALRAEVERLSQQFSG